MSGFGIKERRLAFQRVKKSALHCCVPLCSNSSRYNSLISFHSFPVDTAVRAQWLIKIRRESFSPTKHTRVCSRHFQPGDLVVTVGGLRRLQKGATPVLFSWNEYALPTPRPNVRERKSRGKSLTPVLTANSESEMETAAPDHDYCATAVMANENEALHRKISSLHC